MSFERRDLNDAMDLAEVVFAFHPGSMPSHVQSTQCRVNTAGVARTP